MPKIMWCSIMTYFVMVFIVYVMVYSMMPEISTFAQRWWH